MQVRRGTPLFDAVGVEEMGVNSYHHQGIRRLGQGLEVAATAPDGMVEAVYLPEHPLRPGGAVAPGVLPSQRPAQREDFPGLCAGVQRGPSEASVKVLPAFSKAAGCGAEPHDLALDLMGVSQKKS